MCRWLLGCPSAGGHHATRGGIRQEESGVGGLESGARQADRDCPPLARVHSSIGGTGRLTGVAVRGITQLVEFFGGTSNPTRQRGPSVSRCSPKARPSAEAPVTQPVRAILGMTPRCARPSLTLRVTEIGTAYWQMQPSGSRLPTPDPRLPTHISLDACPALFHDEPE